MRGFLLSLAFVSLAFLAFNPYLVIEIQERLGVSSGYVPAADAPDTIRPGSPVLPRTSSPDGDNLPRLAGYNKIARNDPWIGPTPCGEDIFAAPENLPGLSPRQDGPLLTTPIETSYDKVINAQPTFLYTSESGVSLKLVQPVIEYYDVSGFRFRDTQDDIFTRQPLKTLREASAEYLPEIYDRPETSKGRARSAVIGDIFSPTTLSYTVTGSRDRYRLVLNRTELTSAYMVTLPRWKYYTVASTADKARWDDFFCNAAHHELGHLRIRLDILAETLDGFASLPPASSSKEMEELTIAYRKDINARVQERQDAYHVYNGGGSRHGMIELPYADLPFPWLEETRLEETKSSVQEN